MDPSGWPDFEPEAGQLADSPADAESTSSGGRLTGGGGTEEGGTERPAAEDTAAVPVRPPPPLLPPPPPSPVPSPRPHIDQPPGLAGSTRATGRPAAEEGPADLATTGPVRRRWSAGWRAVAVLTAVAALLLAFDGFSYARYRTEQRVVARNFPVHDGAARSLTYGTSDQLLAAAKQAAAQYVSYDYRHIQQDKAATASVLTGLFKDQYTQSMDQTIIPVALQVQAVVVGQTLTAGVSSINDAATQGVVIAFVNETVTNTRIHGPRVDLVRLRLTLDKVGDNWLISKVESM